MNRCAMRSVGVLVALSGLAAAAPSAMGQATGRVWVAFNGAAPGSPTSIAVDRGASTEDRTVFNVSLSGYYVEQVIVPGVGTFQKVSLPEDEEALLRVDGKPGLPILGMLVGIPTNAPGVGQPVVTVLESTDVDGILVYPTQPEAIEEPGNFPVVPFTQDGAAYLSRAPYPAADSVVGPAASEFMGLKVQSVQVNPFRYVPSTRRMTIRNRLRVEIPHDGAALPPVPMTRRTASSLGSRVDNWAALAQHVQPNLMAYKGCYLILTPQRYLDEIEPLAQQKRERGFNVVIRTTESTGNSVAQIKSAIQEYHDTCTSGDDHYVLMVGDVNDIPLAVAPGSGKPSDHVYACLDAGDWPDVWLGRLSVDSEADLTTQVSKVLTYEDNPPSSSYYDDVELIAHRQVDNGYIACMQDVAAFSGYVQQPTFTLRAGTSTTGTNANVTTDIEAGRHIVMYRGHGSSLAWTGWDFNSADFGTTQIAGVTNTNLPSIVLNVACTNSALDQQGDCFAERWMETSRGAVASYGATRTTGTGRNHVFARAFFKSLYGGTPAILSHTVNCSWLTAAIELGPDVDTAGNWYQYLLLGDPEMKVYTGNPGRFTLVVPPQIGPRRQEIILRALSFTGAPVSGAIIAVHKNGEVLDNLYSAADGSVRIVVDPLTEGEISVRAITEFDSRASVRTVIRVVGCRADFNDDGGVDSDDVIEFFAAWDRGLIEADFNGDGGVDGDDVIAFFGRWDIGC